MMARLRACRLALLLGWLLGACGAAAASSVPDDAAAFAYRQRPGTSLPLQAVLRDSGGATVRLGELGRGLPLVLALGYFHCPTLCGVVRDDMLRALDGAALVAGRDYTLVAVSIDPAETPADAASAKAADFAAALGLAQAHHVEMPITEQMAAILKEGKSPQDAIRDLMARPGREE